MMFHYFKTVAESISMTKLHSFSPKLNPTRLVGYMTLIKNKLWIL